MNLGHGKGDMDQENRSIVLYIFYPLKLYNLNTSITL